MNRIEKVWFHFLTYSMNVYEKKIMYVYEPLFLFEHFNMICHNKIFSHKWNEDSIDNLFLFIDVFFKMTRF